MPLIPGGINMSDIRARMFNRRARSKNSHPERILSVLDIKKGQIVADIGVGGGYFSLEFSRGVGPEGMVYGIDANPGFLEHLERCAREQKVSNITALTAREDAFPQECRDCDLIFLRNVYHHLSERSRYFSEAKRALKKEGRVAIIDYKEKGTLRFHRLFGHAVERDTIESEMEAAGFVLEEEYDILPQQNFLIFRH